MFMLTKEFTFEAAHRLPHHDGKCQRLHGHSFKMRVIVKNASLVKRGAKEGMVQDFSEISAIVKPLIEEKLDHHFLNETTELDSPTSEELARWIYYQLSGKLALLQAVEVDETCTSSCHFEEEELVIY